MQSLYNPSGERLCCTSKEIATFLCQATTCKKHIVLLCNVLALMGYQVSEVLILKPIHINSKNFIFEMIKCINVRVIESIAENNRAIEELIMP